MTWFSPLTPEQQQRLRAVREARKLLILNDRDPEPDAVMRLADFILGGPTDNEGKW